MKKGFILSMDVMVAIILAATLTTAILYFISYPKVDTNRYLYLASNDFLAVADKSGALAEAVSGDSSRLNAQMLLMPDNLCFDLKLINRTDQTVYSSSSGCPTNNTYVVGKRSVGYNSSSYIARLRMWYR